MCGASPPGGLQFTAGSWWKQLSVYMSVWEYDPGLGHSGFFQSKSIPKLIFLFHGDLTRGWLCVNSGDSHIPTTKPPQKMRSYRILHFWKEIIIIQIPSACRSTSYVLYLEHFPPRYPHMHIYVIQIRTHGIIFPCAQIQRHKMGFRPTQSSKESCHYHGHRLSSSSLLSSSSPLRKRFCCGKVIREYGECREKQTMAGSWRGFPGGLRCMPILVYIRRHLNTSRQTQRY